VETDTEVNCASTGEDELRQLTLGPSVRTSYYSEKGVIYSESSLQSPNRDSSGAVAPTTISSIGASVAPTPALPSSFASAICAQSKEMPPAVLLPFTLEKTIYLRKKNSYLGT